MMENDRIKTIEVEAVTVEAAIRKALKSLGARKKDVMIEVLNEEHKGLFGMEGADPAKIRVTLKGTPGLTTL